MPSSGRAVSTTAPVAVTTPPTTVQAAVLGVTIKVGSIYGTIGAGPGGKGTAELQDDHGHTWRRGASASGEYRFDGLVPGHYLLTLGAISASAPCAPPGPCVGSASMYTRDDIQLASGEQHRADYDAYGPTRPAAP